MLKDFENGGFNLPEVNNSEVRKDEGPDEKGKEIRYEQDKAKIRELYEKRNGEMFETLHDVEKEIEESEKGVKEVSKGLDGVVDISYRDKQDLMRGQVAAKAEIAKVEEEINRSEYDALQIPEDFEGQVADVYEFKKEIGDKVKQVKKEAEGSIEDLRKKREEFVKDFIEKSVKGIKEKLEDVFGGTINKKNAKEIISYKIEKEVELAAKRFIETGDEADFGFEASVEVSTYETEERGQTVIKKYVTGYTMVIDGQEKKIRSYDKPLAVSLVEESGRRDMQKKIRYGEKKSIKQRKAKIA